MGYLNKGVAGYRKTSFSTSDAWGPDWSAVPGWLWFLLAASVTMVMFSLL